MLEATAAAFIDDEGYADEVTSVATAEEVATGFTEEDMTEEVTSIAIAEEDEGTPEEAVYIAAAKELEDGAALYTIESPPMTSTFSPLAEGVSALAVDVEEEDSVEKTVIVCVMVVVMAEDEEFPGFSLMSAAATFLLAGTKINVTFCAFGAGMSLELTVVGIA